MRFRSRPIEVEAIQFVGGRANVGEITEWLAAAANRVDALGIHATWFFTKQGHNLQAWSYVKGSDWGSDVVAALYNHLHGNWLPVRKGDWIVMLTDEDVYTCDPDVMERKYEEIR